MSKLANLLAIAASGYAGYVKGSQMEEDRAAQKAKDEFALEELKRQKEDRDRADKLRTDIAKSQEDVQVGVATNTGATYTDPELVAQDNRENAKFARQAAANTGEPEIPIPVVEATGYTAGDKSFQNEGDARFAVGGLNSRAEKARRASEVMRKSGNLSEAEKYYQMAKTIEQEGVLAAASAIRALAPKPEALYGPDKKPLSVRTDIDPEIIETLNKTGGGAIKLPQGAYAEHYPTISPGGVPMTETRILSKDGKVLAENIGQTLRGMQSFMDQYKIDKDDQDRAIKAQEVKDKREYQSGMLGIYQQNADTNATKAAGQQPQAAPVWDDKADTFLKQRYTVTDPTSGAVSVDGDGLQFGKAVALSRARSNGGDATTGLGYAFDVDNRLKQAAGDDPAKLRKLRNDYLKSIAPAPAPVGQSPEFAGKQAEYDAGTSQRISDQRKILEQELAGETNPDNIARLKREIARLPKESAGSPAAQAAAAARTGPRPGGISKPAPAGAETPMARNGESIAERNRRYAQMNTLSGTSRSKAVDAAAKRDADVKENFDSYLAMIKPDASRAERFKALEWFNDHNDLMTNEQRKRLREARAKAG